MVCNLGYIWGKWGEHAYKIRVTGEGATYRDRKRLWVSCAEGIVMVAQSYIKEHMAILHGICGPHIRGVDEKGEVPTTYVISFPRILHSVRCSVLGCPAIAHSA